MKNLDFLNCFKSRYNSDHTTKSLSLSASIIIQMIHVQVEKKFVISIRNLLIENILFIVLFFFYRRILFIYRKKNPTKKDKERKKHTNKSIQAI